MIKLRDCKLATDSGDLYHPDLPLPVKFTAHTRLLNGDLDVSRNKNIVWLTSRRLQKFAAFLGEDGLEIIELEE